jgi:homoserine dehydrogenase
MIRAPLILLGAGQVGRALVRQLLEAEPVHARRDGIRFPIVAWCDGTGAVVDEEGISAEILHETLAAKAGGTPLARSPYGYYQDSLPAIVDVIGRKGAIVADTTASDATVPALALALGRGYCAATANKVPLAGPQELFDRLTATPRFRYESTVASAVPVIEAARGLVRANDRVDVVRGALSGTLGFLCTGLQAGRHFSELVHDAMARGYTEPDPRTDLVGVDVARKALIIARTLGWRMEPEEVTVEPLLPEAMLGLPLPEFLECMAELDAGFAVRSAVAAAEGQTLRYVAELSDGRATVGLRSVPLASPLGRLRGNDNLVTFSTRYYPDEPLVLQGRGAGVDAAAAGVHADIVALAEGRRAWSKAA